MKAIGEYLKSTRDEKGLSLELVARETNISKSYLEALEEEKYDVFPGEPYLIGFLRTYSDYLGLSPEEIVTRYKNIKIQEQPAPVEALIIKKPHLPPKVILISAGAGAALLLGIFVIPPIISALGSIKWNLGGSGAREPAQYTLTDQKPLFENRLFVQDSILVQADSESFTLGVKSIGPGMVLDYGQGDTILRSGEEIFLDLNNNSVMDLRLFLPAASDINANSGAVLTAEKMVRITDNAGATGGSPLGQEALAPQPVGEQLKVERPTSSKVLLTEDLPRPFSLDVIFRGPAFFRFQVDDKLREEGYFQKPDTVRVEAVRKAVIWVSNAGSFTGRVSGSEVDLGRAGEVSSGVLSWVKDPVTGKHQLRLEPLF